MTILLTGGTGNTATALARQLKAAGIPFLATQRRAKLASPELQDVPVAELDFSNAETYDKPFEHPAAVASPIRALYAMVPGESDPAFVNAFIDHAIKQNVPRVVLLGGQGAGIDAPYPYSKVWKHLSQTSLDYAVLQPSWFNENLFKHYYLNGIKTEKKLYSSTEDGKMGFVAVDDIAASALALLTSKSQLNGEAHLIIGPEVVTHDEVAERLSRILGKTIQHVRVAPEDRGSQVAALGVPEQRAKFIGFLETLIQKNIAAEGFPNDNVTRLTGRDPESLNAWIERHKEQFE